MNNLAVDTRMTRLHMMLVREKDNASATGQPGSTGNQDLDHPVHVVLVTTVTELDRIDITPEMTNSEPWTTCCGVVFAPGTVELVAWGTRKPHEECEHESTYPRTFVERMYREARDEALSFNVSEEDMTDSIVALDNVLTKRGRDWVRNTAGNKWTYEASFNGAFYSNHMLPRGVDIGLQPLRVELLIPGEVYVHSCGIRDGCRRHLVHTEPLSLNDMAHLKRRITSQEAAAESFRLPEMVWCLVAGDCSVITLHADI
jgi:hypothetical protein